jgi:pyrimidine operon attenuation protein/uracil phosphoribosyltransferase
MSVCLVCSESGKTFFCVEVRIVKLKGQMMDETAVERAIVRIAHQIVERNHGTEELCIIGIKSKGYPIAKRIADAIYKIEGVRIDLGALDITSYRDDLSNYTKKSVINDTDIPFSLIGKKVVLVDDVIYTGRSARAAMDAVMDQGRAAKIQLAVLVDRGHRELPIRPDFVGKNIPTSRMENVLVRLKEIDGETGVFLYQI